MSIRSISILGCGWLGLPLGKFLVEKGFDIKGSTTSEAKRSTLNEIGIKPYLLHFNPTVSDTESIRDFLNSDLLIVNIPPSLRTKTESYHVEQMKELDSYLTKSSIKYLLYVSSTSVYPDLNREVVEEDVSKESEAENKTLFWVEDLFKSNEKLKTTIVRCAGLAGYDRNLVKHFAGKTDLKGGDTPVNLIHRDDVIEIIYAILQNNCWGHTLNISSPEHPLRNDLYPYLAQKYKYPLPVYSSTDSSNFKIISIKKLQKLLHYRFKFPDPKEFYYQKNF